MINAILFDFDGTVFDTGDGIKKSAQYALKKHGIEADYKDLDFFVGPPLVDSFMSYGMSHEEAVIAVADYRERYRPIGLYESCVYEGVSDLLAELKSTGLRLAIATSKPLDMAETLLERGGICNLFEVRCGISKTQVDGTKQQIIQQALEALGSPSPDQVLMVGDTRFDVIGAHACGLKAIGVCYGYGTQSSLQEAGADWLVNSPAELRELLFRLVKAV